MLALEADVQPEVGYVSATAGRGLGWRYAQQSWAMRSNGTSYRLGAEREELRPENQALGIAGWIDKGEPAKESEKARQGKRREERAAS